MNDDSYVVDLFGVLSCVKPSGLDSWLYLLSTCTCSWKLFTCISYMYRNSSRSPLFVYMIVHACVCVLASLVLVVLY